MLYEEFLRGADLQNSQATYKLYRKLEKIYMLSDIEKDDIYGLGCTIATEKKEPLRLRLEYDEKTDGWGLFAYDYTYRDLQIATLYKYGKEADPMIKALFYGLGRDGEHTASMPVICLLHMLMWYYFNNLDKTERIKQGAEYLNAFKSLID